MYAVSIYVVLNCIENITMCEVPDIISDVAPHVKDWKNGLLDMFCLLFVSGFSI